MFDTVTLGLISDTHMPARWKQLPETVFDALAGVDLVLHAGDLGKLWVLDELSRIAPVVAVHGNDETAEAQAALPYLQTVAAVGRRIVLTHSHFPDRREEVESRKIDDWTPKLARRAEFGKAHGADIVVFGHSHVPMAAPFDGVWLVNPGAIASGGWGSRQRVQSVARLTLGRQGAPAVEFINLKDCQPFTPEVDFSAGFAAAMNQFSESILEPELGAQWGWVIDNLYAPDPEAWIKVYEPLAYACFFGERQTISVQDVVEAARAGADGLPPLVLERLRESPVFGRYW